MKQLVKGKRRQIFFSQETVENSVLLIRGRRVILDRTLAGLYGVETRALNQAVRRNLNRFPPDFMFSLTRNEIMNLSQSVISSGIKHAPNVFVFTQEGIAMLSSVLRSAQAVKVNIAIMRAFVKLKEAFASQKEILHKLSELEKQVKGHDSALVQVFEAIRSLIVQEEKPKPKIGFHHDSD